MANVKEQFGLRPYRKLDGTPLVGAQNRYTIASNMGHAIYQGDLVVVTTAGNIEKYNNTNNSAGLSTAAVGVFNGVFYTDPTTSKPTFRNHFPASLSPGDAIAFVADDPDQLYIAQQDANDIGAADLGNNAEMIMAAGSTTTGMSKAEIDSSTAATGNATYMLKILDFYDTPSNDASAANSVLVVKINNHQLAASTGTAGV